MLHCVLDTLLGGGVAEAVATGNDTTDVQLNVTLASSGMPAEATRANVYYQHVSMTNVISRQGEYTCID